MMPLSLETTAALVGVDVINSRGKVVPFVYQPETEAFYANAIAAGSTAPTRREKRTFDTVIKRMKACENLWGKMRCFARGDIDIYRTARNWKTGAALTVVGGLTPTNNELVPAAGKYIESGVLLSDLSASSCGIAFWSRTNSQSGTSDIGAITAAGDGLSIAARDTTEYFRGRCGSHPYNTFGNNDATDGDWNDAAGFKAINRVDATNVQAWGGPVKRATVAVATGTMTGEKIVFGGTMNNGTFTASPRNQSCWAVFDGLTDGEMDELANIMQWLDVEYRFGRFDTYDAGTGPETVTADVVVYGATPSGLAVAYEAKRQGLSVVVCGGWRERQPGGMSSAGLGFADFAVPAKLGGFSRLALTRIQALNSTASDKFAFMPRLFDIVMRGFFDPARTDGKDVPFYWSSGRPRVTKRNARIQSFVTHDGRTFNGTYFIDASYEGDLMHAAAVTTRLGREAATEFNETAAGYRDVASTFAGLNHQFKNKAGTLVSIDPYKAPGNPASGVLPGVKGVLGQDTPKTIGVYDARIQSYNFRITATTRRRYRRPFPSTPPIGYDVTRFEPLLRLLAADPTLAMTDLFILNVVDNGTYDINAKGGFSTDFWGEASVYPSAPIRTREAIWQAHLRHIFGLFYLLQYDPDPRVPTALRTEALTYGLDIRHYPNNPNGDGNNVMPQLYVREAYRLDNDFMLRDSDLSAADGTTPRSIKTISMISYTRDSHSTQMVVDPNNGSPRLWLEGNFQNPLPGNGSVPVPYEVMTPRKFECENLLVTFGIAATHVAFGSYRMEFTAMQAGQSAAFAIKQAIANGNLAVQDVDYTALRTALLASAAQTGETAPVLDQVN